MSILRKDFFKPDDFNSWVDAEGLANIANEKLSKLIESWPVVYGHGWNFESPTPSRYWHWRKDGHTHTARLAFIEEIPKEPCKHATPYRLAQDEEEWRCADCGVELEATWKEKK